MSNNNEMKCFCIGLGVGVAASLLFAPRTGADTRQLLQSKTQEGADFLKAQANSLKDQANTVASAAAAAANDAVERGTKTIRNQKESVIAAVEAGKQAYRETSTLPS